MDKRAFTMIELVMVIVVMGIVASIGAEIISKLYENYLKTRAINRLQAQSETVLDQIAKRLTYRIKGSVIAREKSPSPGVLGNYVPLSDANSSYQILEWIGKDNDSFRGESNGTVSIPGWSGFIDLDSNDTNRTAGIYGTLKTSGSELNVTNQIIDALSYGTVELNGSETTAKRPVIIFKGLSGFDIAHYGWSEPGHNGDGNYTLKVSYTPTVAHTKINILNFDDNLTKKGVTEISEQYNLAWSAYAIVSEGNNTNDFNLTLYYNFQPWENDENYTNGNHSVLAEHVSTFRFTQIGETIRVKLCLDDNQTGYDFAFCKERAIY